MKNGKFFEERRAFLLSAIERAEAKRLIAEYEKLAEMGRRQAGDESTELGRKRKWKGQLGYCLICAVRALTADGTSQAKAFRDLHYWAQANHHSPKAQANFEQLVGEYWQYLRDECRLQKPRQLAARHSEALNAWGPCLKREDTLEAQMERFRALSAANEDRAELLRKSPPK